MSAYIRDSFNEIHLDMNPSVDEQRLGYQKQLQQ